VNDPEYTDTLEITYSGGEPGKSSFAVAKVIAKHPGPGKWGSLENFVIDIFGTTVAEYMLSHHADKKILSYKAVKSRLLTAEVQITTELTPLSPEQTGRLTATLREGGPCPACAAAGYVECKLSMHPAPAEQAAPVDLTDTEAELILAEMGPAPRLVAIGDVTVTCACGSTDGTHKLPCPVANALLDRLDERFAAERKAVLGAAEEMVAAPDPQEAVNFARCNHARVAVGSRPLTLEEYRELPF
jgi:hypothetical protein